MTDIQVVLFDLDGTLVDSKPGILASFSKVLEPYGVVLTPEQQRDVLGPPLKESFAQFLAQEHVEKAVKDYRAFYETTGIYQCTAYAGVEKMLADLKEDGFMLAVATCKLRKAAQFVLRHLHLEQYFDYVGGALPEKMQLWWAIGIMICRGQKLAVYLPLSLSTDMVCRMNGRLFRRFIPLKLLWTLAAGSYGSNSNKNGSATSETEENL